ncbi:unnamed protein product, partial [Linum tenue]
PNPEFSPSNQSPAGGGEEEGRQHFSASKFRQWARPGNYSWGQSLEEVTITVPVPAGTKSRQIVCEIKKKSLKLGLKGEPAMIIDGELFGPVKVSDSFWQLEDQKTVSVLLTKFEEKNKSWWKSLVKGGP